MEDKNKEAIEVLKQALNSENTTPKMKEILQETIKQRQTDDDIEARFEEFINEFEKELETNSTYELDTPVLTNLYENYIQNIFTTGSVYKTAVHLQGKIKEELKKSLSEEQQLLLDEIDYCNIEMNSDIAKKAFLYGYAMSAQMKDETIKIYSKEHKNKE